MIFHHEQRQCNTANGTPKLAYESFDEAMDVVAKTRNARVHAYRCAEHGWHVGNNFDRTGNPRS